MQKEEEEWVPDSAAVIDTTSWGDIVRQKQLANI